MTHGVPRILLINPNSAVATTAMMVAIARETASPAAHITGATATRAPKMIVDPDALTAAAAEVIEIGLAEVTSHDALIVAAFGDPGLNELRAASSIPVAGIAESAMREAAAHGRFAVVTTTPRLASRIDAYVAALGLTAHYLGTHLTRGDPHHLTQNPANLLRALAEATGIAITRDHAQSVIIGGGPLAQAAAELQPLFPISIIAPIPAAIRRVLTMLAPV